MSRSTLKRISTSVAVACAAVVLGAAPAGAQQLVDAGREGDGSGGLAFVLMAAMVMLIAAALFFMDRIRRRAQARSETAGE
jgi:hypothetical protein